MTYEVSMTTIVMVCTIVSICGGQLMYLLYLCCTCNLVYLSAQNSYADEFLHYTMCDQRQTLIEIPGFYEMPVNVTFGQSGTLFYADNCTAECSGGK